MVWLVDFLVNNMDKYIKVNISLKDKLNLLFFDLLPEVLLKYETTYKYKKDKEIQVEDVKENHPNDIMNISFFDNIDDVEDSNL